MYKAIDKWLLPYFKQALKRPKKDYPIHVMFCLADHFEPFGPKQDSQEKALERLNAWIKNYPKITDAYRDSKGRRPRHSFFYPQDEYDPKVLDRLAAFCRDGYGEVEVHLHHDKDSPEALREKLEVYRSDLHDKHGALGQGPDGQAAYAFIHGNWTLCNSHPDGLHCGVNQELSILQKSGCFVDMTMPSGPSPTQSRIVNSIYYASDRNGPRSHDYGSPVTLNQSQPENSLMLIQGPIGLNWGWRKSGILPHLDYGDIGHSAEPIKSRVDFWVKQHIHVKGRPDWLFIKVHCHGGRERNMKVLLDKPIQDMHDYLCSRYNDGRYHQLHYVTAREMYNIVKAAEAGERGNPDDYRDYVIKPPTA